MENIMINPVDFILDEQAISMANDKKEFTVIVSENLNSWEEVNKDCPIGEYNKLLFLSGDGVRYYGLARSMGIKKCLAKTLTLQDVLESIHGHSTRKGMFKDLEERYKQAKGKFLAINPSTELYIISFRINELNLKTLNSKYKYERNKPNTKN
jgi:hypothetical protein